MPDFQPLNAQRHAGQTWQKPADFAFARNRGVVPVAADELPKAMGQLPLAFTATETAYQLVALLGREPDRNLYVGREGRWRGGYVPAFLRTHPFYLADADDGSRVVVVDATSDLLHSEESGGEPLFDAEGNPSEALQPVVDFLTSFARSLNVTDQGCRALAEAELLEPWSPTVHDEEGNERTLGGLHRVSEAALNQIDAATLQRLRDAGALHVAYGQMLGHTAMERLSQLAQVEAREAKAQKQARDLGVDFSDVFGGGDTLDFDRLE